MKSSYPKGFRLGFVGGGDIHDGRPGDSLIHRAGSFTEDDYAQGFTAALAPALTRDHIYDAMRNRRTYATTQSRIYLDTHVTGTANPSLTIRAAAEDGISEVAIIRNGVKTAALLPEADARIVDAAHDLGEMAPDEYCYVRVYTRTGEMAWSSPVWGDEIRD